MDEAAAIRPASPALDRGTLSFDYQGRCPTRPRSPPKMRDSAAGHCGMARRQGGRTTRMPARRIASVSRWPAQGLGHARTRD